MKQPEMVVPLGDDVLANLSEGELLDLAITILGLGKRQYSRMKEICGLLDRSPQHVNAAINNDTSIGGMKWATIEKAINLPLYSRWFALKKEQL